MTESVRKLRILCVDDEAPILKALAVNLRARDYEVDLAASGEDALRLAAAHHPDAIVLDLGLPGISGIEVIEGLRGWSAVPIVVLSARDAEHDKIAALDAGADDYLTKPFRTGELLARVRAALRHRQVSEQGTAFKSGSLAVDLSTRIVKVNDEIVKLTPTEYSLLALFVKNAGRVLTHQYILREIWGPAFEEESQYSRVYVGQLRKKIENDPAMPKLLVTESGIGYRLCIDE